MFENFSEHFISKAVWRLTRKLFCFFFFSSTDTSYHLAVKTGDMLTAGTDANVYFQLIGNEGETEKIQLRQGGKAEKRFEKGRVDKFIVETVDVGTVRWLTNRLHLIVLVYSDNTGMM